MNITISPHTVTLRAWQGGADAIIW
ncbi:uncharacterized protein METZ01_LOCUS431182 [marine metagenome]|uniref:Uncharacterized protein n=1 Tax=marine metagenome TaxID=408172 RepID=A0A382Y770_9ZZZZ